MSQLIRSILAARSLFCYSFWWLLGSIFFDPSQSKRLFLMFYGSYFSCSKHKIDDPYRTCGFFCFLINRLEIVFCCAGTAFAEFCFRCFQNIDFGSKIGFSSPEQNSLVFNYKSFWKIAFFDQSWRGYFQTLKTLFCDRKIGFGQPEQNSLVFDYKSFWKITIFDQMWREYF